MVGWVGRERGAGVLACAPAARHPRSLKLTPPPPLGAAPPLPAENKFVSTGCAEEIARAAGGKYYYLPNASDAAIAAATSSAMADAKLG